METDTTVKSLEEHLSGPLTQIVDRHKDKISAMLIGCGSATTLAQALGKDENVRRVASYCYPLLPFLLKIVVKEPTFVGFVMEHREKVLGRLVPPPAPGEPDGMTKAS